MAYVRDEDKDYSNLAKRYMSIGKQMYYEGHICPMSPVKWHEYKCHGKYFLQFLCQAYLRLGWIEGRDEINKLAEEITDQEILF
jgi:hypothetical protein